MIAAMDRRTFIASAAGAAGTLALPARVFAQPSGLDARAAAILEIARREVARAGGGSDEGAAIHGCDHAP